MIKFQNFEVLYGSAVEILAATDNVTVIAAAKRQIKVLFEQFTVGFPRTLDTAIKHPDFDCEQFMEMLLKFPELTLNSSEKFVSFIANADENDVSVPPKLRERYEKMRTKPLEILPEHRLMVEALKKSFPSSLNEAREKVEDFKVAVLLEVLQRYPYVYEGQRQPFMDLMNDLCRNGVKLPKEMELLWRGWVLNP